MLEFWQNLLSPNHFIPHGHCYLWNPSLVWLHLLSDALIALSYFSIPAALIYFVRQRQDVPFKGVFLLFGAFIISCGLTHLVGIWTIWHPAYWLSGAVKAVTALVSFYTVLTLAPIIPRALALPSPATLEMANQKLAREIEERQQAEATVRQLNQELEARVSRRTADLQATNRRLQKTTAMLKQRNQDLDQFARIVSHDLKAPLRAIANLSEWIEEDLGGQLPKPNQEQLQLLRSRVQRMDGLINGLLEYARVGKVEATPEAVNLNDLLAEIVDLLSPPEQFTIDIEPNMPTLTAHMIPLQQVFANLISNAIKHHHRPDGHIRISVQEQPDEYEFAIADDGPGINPDFHEQIFEIFKSLKPRDSADNTGIGLSIVKKIIESEGGTIRLDSEVGQGSCFYFTWPKQPVKVETTSES